MGWRSAFSTLGCSGVPLERVVSLARDGGWEGLELRAAAGEPVHVGLTADERENVRRLLAGAALTPLAIASYVDVDAPAASDDVVVADLLAHVRLAGDLGAPFVRVFPGGPSADDAAVRRLREAARHLADHPGVMIVLETHDSCPTGAAVGSLLKRVGHPRVRAVWDVQHPWRAGEPVVDTLRALQPVLAYVQITDARSREDATPRLPGEGVLPLRELYHELRRVAYDGWVSLEWASHWYPEAPPLTDALPAARRWLAGSLGRATACMSTLGR